jgi:hypothetical protein
MHTAKLNNGTMKSNVSFFFQDLLRLYKNTIEMRISLVNCQIPCSYYVINSNNNKIYINGSLYTFPVGNYNVNTFITAWSSVVGSSWTLSFNTLTNILTFSNTSAFTINEASNSLYPVLGFVTGNSYSSSGNSLTAPYCINFSGLSRIFICSPNLSISNVSWNNLAFSKTLGSAPVRHHLLELSIIIISPKVKPYSKTKFQIWLAFDVLH